MEEITEIQNAIELHAKASRLLSLMRALKMRLHFLKTKGVVNEKTAIYIHQFERLEYLYDNLICKIADVTLVSRKV